jgi:hypothetical protein
MENQDKIYKQFKDAASKVESNNFLAMDKVWGNIEGKLETKALKTENKIWKKIAVAASVLLVTTFAYQFLKDKESEKITPIENVVSSETEEKFKADSVFSNQAVVTAQQENPLIKEDASEIIKQNLNSKENVALNENANVLKDSIHQNQIIKNKWTDERQDKNSGFFATRKFNATGVKHYEQEINTEKTEEAVAVQEKASPLMVVNGKAVKSKKESILADEEIESVEYLDDPLYVINGEEYTEKELFGPNPTSPYYPLNKQEITSTTIFQGESATNLYGEKGKKGVVIITTKNGKYLKN